MTELKGIPISGGVCRGKAVVIPLKQKSIHRRSINPEEVTGEIKRFQDTIENLIQETETTLSDLNLKSEEKEILNSHIMIIQDPELFKAIEKALNTELVSIEAAIETHFQKMTDYFMGLGNEMFAQRAYDYEDIGQRLLAHLSGDTESIFDSVGADSIPVLVNVNPSAVIKFFNNGVRGFCSMHGSHTSHSSILAKSMGLSYITGLPSLIDSVHTGDDVIIDGNNGILYIQPDSETITHFEKIIALEAGKQLRLQKILNKKAITLDNQQISLSVNLELPEELDFIHSINAQAIGLFRTEFLYLENETLPTEDMQFEIYKAVLEGMGDKPVTIRTMDLGGDKLAGFQKVLENNPYLGCRGIRLSLKHPHLFKTQIRALLRAGEYGHLKVMFPMINDTDDYLKAMVIVEECKRELTEKGIVFSHKIEFGAMIEVPSAAITSESLAEHCDFFSIGTNDLTQYTLAVDRNNEEISPLFIPHHPAVLRLMYMTLQSGMKRGIPVSICGDIASNLNYLPLLLKLGFRDLSVSPRILTEIKERILNIDLSKLKEFNPHKMSLEDIETYIKTTE
ncbi:MAG: phosphoenolpyruvate--protein phosphotransferase [Candidatus Cloacimonetes bacterium]|nr:phosphoenolpyruvate--protein phosphotransferase [Candidatus Cloacimonadota bacterium]